METLGDTNLDLPFGHSWACLGEDNSTGILNLEQFAVRPASLIAGTGL